jgi:hypothetical protein
MLEARLTYKATIFPSGQGTLSSGLLPLTSSLLSLPFLPSFHSPSPAFLWLPLMQTSLRVRTGGRELNQYATHGCHPGAWNHTVALCLPWTRKQSLPAGGMLVPEKLWGNNGLIPSLSTPWKSHFLLCLPPEEDTAT